MTTHLDFLLGKLKGTIAIVFLLSFAIPIQTVLPVLEFGIELTIEVKVIGLLIVFVGRRNSQLLADFERNCLVFLPFACPTY